MRTRFALLVVLLAPAFAAAQTAEIDADIKARLQLLKFVAGLYDADAGAFKPTPDGKPSLRATTAGLRAFKYLGAKQLGGELPGSPDAMTAFVLKCYDPETGGFADAPGGKPDVPTTAVGVMAAAESGIPKPKYVKAMDYLKANATTFEEVRLGAAAVEAWGVKDCPFELAPWFEVTEKTYARLGGIPTARDGGRREAGSVAAFYLRLGRPLPVRNAVSQVLRDGQRDDGAWGKADAKGSDLETTYRVMRAFVLLKEQPADVGKLRAFVAKCRNADGGYAVAPGGPSNVGAVYYAAVIGHWLDGMK